MMKRALLAVALLWSVCTVSQAQDRAACERIVRLVAEAVGAGSIGEIEPFLAPGFIFSGQEGDRARAVMKLLVAQLGERVERIETGPAGTDGGGTGAGLRLHLCGAAGPEGGDLSLRRGGPPETAGVASDPGQDAGRQGRDVRKTGCPAARYSGPPARESADRDGAAGRPGAHVHPR